MFRIDRYPTSLLSKSGNIQRGAKMDDKILYSSNEASDVVGLSASTLAKLRLSGDGPVFVKLGRRVFYRPGDLMEWVNARRFSSTSQYVN